MSINEMLMAAAGTGGGDKTFVEDVFSTYLYTGNGSTQTITNDIDLAGEGGMVWIKNRVGSSSTYSHFLFDTNRGVLNEINSNTTDAQASLPSSLTSFNSDGFSVGSSAGVNRSTEPNCSWTFRKQPKFFDVVTYTGNGTSGRTVSHNLGSAPGMIIVKNTNEAEDWQVYHRANTGAPATDYLRLNETGATTDSNTRWNDTQPTSSVFSLGTDTSVNGSGSTYVAYLFAHDAGGFGEAGTDNVISCGSYTGNATAGNSINLGFEPQWVMIKRADSTGNWLMHDILRGMPLTGSAYLLANASNAETVGTAPIISPTATGFQIDTTGGTWNTNGGTYIYMAIRRPMKVPTTGTSVYFGSLAGPDVSIPTGFVPDMAIARTRTTNPNYTGTRLQGSSKNLQTNETSAEGSFGWGWDRPSNTFVQSSLGTPVVTWAFRRAPNFFDVVCYTGTGSSGLTITHNLGVAPELMIVKMRSATEDWRVYSATIGNTRAMRLNDTGGQSSPTIIFWNNTSPTASTFTVGTEPSVNSSGSTYVAYLFATCAGVSKVGSYTGNGGTQAIACGFTGGARFVLIKRTDASGGWYVWDTARGIVSGNDPYLLLNTTAAEVTSDDSVDPDSSGFVVNQLSATNINVSSASYIFLAIA